MAAPSVALIAALACGSSLQSAQPAAVPATSSAAPAPSAVATSSPPAAPAAAGLRASEAPLPDSWVEAAVSRVCVKASSADHELTVTDDCTCGQPLGCRATLTGDTLEVTLRSDDEAPATCDDCYPGDATCRAPLMPAARSIEVSVNKQRLGSLPADARGWLPNGQCLE